MKKISLIFKSSNSVLLRYYVSSLVSSFLKSRFIDFSVVFLPKKNKRFTILRSPHVNKKSKTSYSIISYSVLVSLNISEERWNIIHFLICNTPRFFRLKVLVRS